MSVREQWCAWSMFYLLVQRFIPYLEREDDETELSLNSCN